MTFACKKHTLSSGKEIYVYDGLVSLEMRQSVMKFCKQSFYRIGWDDGETEKARNFQFLYAPFTEEEDRSARLLPYLINNTPVGQHVQMLRRTKSVVNLSLPTNTFFAHSHPEKIVILYYVNTIWEHEWHGETVFYSEDLSEIELCIKYTPGRVVVFDASIPHALRPQSSTADDYRFTYAFFYD